MRFLLRLVVLGLAAIGAKSLYDKFAPKAADLREPVGGVIDSAKEAARGVSETAKSAASQVAEDAKQRAEDVRSQAQDAMNTASSDDTPTVATSTTAATNSGH